MTGPGSALKDPHKSAGLFDWRDIFAGYELLLLVGTCGMIQLMSACGERVWM